MNGFNPPEGLKSWHIFVAIGLFICGLLTLIIELAEFVMWIYNHVKII